MRFRSVPFAVILLATPATARAEGGSETTVPGGQSTPVTANPFLPENENVSDCLSALPPPDCGSTERGGAGQWLTFGAMALGTAFIGWRIARGVRRRDRLVSPD